MMENKKPTIYYKLDQDHNIIPVDDIVEWGLWYVENNQTLWYDQIEDIHISTVFTGIDMFAFFIKPPRVFDTAVFKGDSELEYLRVQSCSWQQAYEAHKKAVKAMHRLNKKSLN